MTEIESSYPDNMEIEKNIPVQITEIRKILKEVHGIAIPEKCDNYIARCLRCKDGNLSQATKMIKSLYLFTIDIISGWDVKLQPSFYAKSYYGLNISFPCVNRDSLGRRIFITKITQWNPKKLSFDEMITACWMMAQYTLAENREDQRLGFVLIWDLADVTFELIWAVKQKRVVYMASWAQNGVFGRVKEIHVVNLPRIASLFFQAIRPFLSEKLRNRLKFHPNVESLHKSVDAKNLPTFLGGELSLQDCVDKPFVDGLINYDNYFHDMAENRFPSA